MGNTLRSKPPSRQTVYDIRDRFEQHGSVMDDLDNDTTLCRRSEALCVAGAALAKTRSATLDAGGVVITAMRGTAPRKPRES
ncbi:hypothetical protein J6590_063584 [Homalodisca vitripennis]|nr:hypothetical protein J6590_063584 [Homalodisca vitripennis]